MRRDTLHVDLQMHDLVLTVCRPDGKKLKIADQKVFPGLGMAQVQNAMARHVSDIMIESYRFDPLHASEAEQAIFDEVPHWLAKLCWERDVSVTLHSGQGEHACVLNRDAIKAKVDDRLGSMRAFLGKWGQCDLLLSHASGLLRALVDEFADTEAAGHTVATQNCLDRQEQFKQPPEGLFRSRQIERAAGESSEAPETADRLATHLLCGDLALPLDGPVSVRVEDDGLRLVSGFDEDAALTVVLRGQGLETLRQDVEAELPQTARAGDAISLAGCELRLIRVGDGGRQ